MYFSYKDKTTPSPAALNQARGIDIIYSIVLFSLLLLELTNIVINKYVHTGYLAGIAYMVSPIC